MSDAKSNAPVIPTPHILHFFLLLTALAAMIFYLLSNNVIKSAQHAAQTVGTDSVPSIVAAEEIRKALADANTCAVKALLSNEQGAQDAMANFETDLAFVSDRLVAAAQHMKKEWGEEERQPILKMAQTLPRYATLVAGARVADPKTNAANMRAAVKLAQNEILAQAELLDEINYRHLDVEYQEDKAATTVKCFEVLCAGLLVLAILGGVQFSLLRRFHRILNLPLVCATGLLLVTSVWLVYALSAAQGFLQIAKEDAFDSIHTLWKIRAEAYDADTNVALYLLDSSSSQEYENAFKRKANKLSTISLNDSVLAQLEREYHPEFGGLFGDALRKSRFFPGERTSTDWMIRYHKNYMDADVRIRNLEVSNNHAKAVALWTGKGDDESAWALDKFDKQLSNSLALNNSEFQSNVAQANEQFAPFGWFLPASALMIVFLAWMGLRPRIREYA